MALKPGTDVHVVEPYIADVDMVLIMTVEPGFGGQQFMVDMLPKVGRIGIEGASRYMFARFKVNVVLLCR